MDNTLETFTPISKKPSSNKRKVPQPKSSIQLPSPNENQKSISKMRVGIIGTVGLPARYGGFETLAQYLVEHLGEEFNFTVYCSGPEYIERPRKYLNAKLVYFPLKANGAQSIAFDFLNYAHAFFNCDVLLILGVSGGLAMPFLRLFGKKTVLNIGGLEWQRSKWSAWPARFLRISEAVAVISADKVISDNLGISQHLRKAYHKETTLIEYGGDQIQIPNINSDWIIKYPFLKRPYAFAVARIQSDNNPELLLYAFNQVPETEFVFVGNWNRTEYGRELKRQYEVYPNLHLLEAIYNAEELNVLRAHCAFYVHGHSAGGTNPALVEAMNLSLPIAAYDVIYNRATTENQAQYFRNVKGLVELIIQTPQKVWDEQRPVVKEFANRRYRWEEISKKYGRMFKQL